MSKDDTIDLRCANDHVWSAGVFINFDKTVYLDNDDEWSCPECGKEGKLA